MRSAQNPTLKLPLFFSTLVHGAVAAALATFCLLPVSAKPTELRQWTAKGGFKVEAKAIGFGNGNVQLEKADGSQIQVALDKFTDGDQQTLKAHFGVGTDAGVAPPTAAAGPAGEAANDLPHPLGSTTGELPCGESFYFLYLPTSLRKGEKHPVIFVMNPGGGGPGTATRYIPGAERNRWIIAVSKDSRNGFEGSTAAVDAMMATVEKTLPVDQARMYVSGMSGGSRVAYSIATKNKDIAGVLGCGAGGRLGDSSQISYGLCGTNCYNRTDMANSFKSFKSKDNVLRFFPGRHVWAESDLIEDAITHLNGAFLIANRKKYAKEFNTYIQDLTVLILEKQKSNPMHAHMWTTFLQDRKVLPSELASVHQTLQSVETNTRFTKGLAEIKEFAGEQFGGLGGSQWKSDPKVSHACKREAVKYEGTPWKEILELMSEDAESF